MEDMVMDAAAETEPIDGLDSAADDGGDGAASGIDDNNGLDVADGTEEAPAAEGEPQALDPNAAELAGQQADGRAMPDDIKKSLKALQAVNPTAAGKLRDTFFEAKAFRDVFPTTAEAVKAKEFVDLVGGDDGFKGLQESLEQWSGLHQSFEQNPGDFAKALSQANPEAFAAMVPKALNEWAAGNPSAYSYFSNSVALNTMTQMGLTPQNLQTLYAQVGDNPAAQQILRDVYGMVTGLQGKAQQFQQEQAQKNPEQQKFEKQKQEWEQQRQSEFETGVNGQADSYVVEKSQPLIDQYLGGQVVTEEMRALIAEKVKAELGDRLAKIPGFGAQIDRMYKARDAAQVLPYVQRNVDKILQPAVKAVVERLYRNVAPAKGGKTAGAPGTKAQPGSQVQAQRSTGVIELRAAPDWSRVDRSKTPDTDFLMGRAVLKDGRRVTWQ